MRNLPDYFVRKVSGYPGGIRLTKMTKYYETGRHSFFGGSKDNGGFKGMGQIQRGDPLGGGDYRYWCGTQMSTSLNVGFSRCRDCCTILYSREGRKEHKNQGCGSRLEAAYKALRRTTNCVICQGHTNKKVYGLPLCSNECIREWEFVTPTPMVLFDALEVVRKEEQEHAKK